jgi:hypothetical protein
VTEITARLKTALTEGMVGRWPSGWPRSRRWNTPGCCGGLTLSSRESCSALSPLGRIMSGVINQKRPSFASNPTLTVVLYNLQQLGGPTMWWRVTIPQERRLQLLEHYASKRRLVNVTA